MEETTQLPKLPNAACPFAKADNFAASALGSIDPKVKEDLWEHCESGCMQCVYLWIEVNELIDRLKIKDIVVVLAKLEEEKQGKSKQSKEPIYNIQNDKIDAIEQKVSELAKNQTVFFTEFNQIRKTFVIAIFAITSLVFGLCLYFALTNSNVDFLLESNESYSLDTNTKNSNSNSNIDSNIDDDTNVPFKANDVTNNKNLYQQLDSSIDDFLSSHDKKHLANAQAIAEQIKTRYQDDYGLDLVKYYTQLISKNFQQLQFLRQEFKSLDASPFSANDSKNYLARAEKNQEGFLLIGDLLEAYRTKCVIGRLYLLTPNTTYENILDQGIAYAESNSYLFLKTHFLLWKVKGDSNKEDKKAAIKDFDEVIALINKLQLLDILPTATMSVAATYQQAGENKKALDLSKEALKIHTSKHTTKIALIQIAGMAAFHLGKYNESDRYFQDSIVLAKQHDDLFNLSLSYSLAATFASERRNFEKCNDLLQKAENIANLVNYQPSKTELIFKIRGYQAKNQLKQRNYLQASIFYTEALNKVKEVGTRANLIESAELNEGLALALEKIGDKESANYHTVATYFFKQSSGKKQLNCLLSFLPGKCS